MYVVNEKMLLQAHACADGRRYLGLEFEGGWVPTEKEVDILSLTWAVDKLLGMEAMLRVHRKAREYARRRRVRGGYPDECLSDTLVQHKSTHSAYWTVFWTLRTRGEQDPENHARRLVLRWAWKAWTEGGGSERSFE